MKLTDWIGRSEEAYDILTPTPMAALSATLDRDPQRPSEGTVLPALWHWLYFLPLHRRSELGPDGHGKRGEFLPPVTLPRRMWAGSNLRFSAPLRIGDTVKRVSTIQGVEEKAGRTGPLVFVKVLHEIYANGSSEAALSDINDIVYREERRPGDPAPPAKRAPDSFKWATEWTPDEVLLFRYSALTFNNHRIHYDRRFVTEVEGYPGLIVHGPLIATLLLDLLKRELPEALVSEFEFRAVRPVFDTQRFSVCGMPEADGRKVHLWATDDEGWLCMDAWAVIR